MKNGIKINRPGFTLIEIIISLTLMTVVATMILTFFSSNAFRRGTEPLDFLDAASDLHTVFENVSYDFDEFHAQSGIQDLAAWRARLGSGSPPFSLGNTYGYLNDPGSGGTVSGTYTVIELDYIILTGGTEQTDSSGDNDLLKVTIRDGNGRSLSSIFAQER